MGIGDGSYRTLKNTSTPDRKFADTGSEMMAADISMAPLDVSRMSGYSPRYRSSIATNETCMLKTMPLLPNTTGKAMLSIPPIDALQFDKNIIGAEQYECFNANKMSRPAGLRRGGMALNDPYHSILMGRPSNDMLYEDPLAQSITMYGRLVGLHTPSGCLVNMDIQCLGYGY